MKKAHFMLRFQNSTKSIKKVSNKRRSPRRHRHAYDADIEDSARDSAESNSQPHKYWYTNDSDGEKNASNVTEQSGESEEEDLDEGIGENERRLPMSYYLTPPRTVERPIKHWYTGDTDNEDNDGAESDGADDEEDESDDGDRELTKEEVQTYKPSADHILIQPRNRSGKIYKQKIHRYDLRNRPY